MADYNITAVTRRKVFSGSAGVGPYAFTFPILTQTDIVVYKNSTKLTLTTDYTVTINGTNGTGSVTLVVAATGSDTITIIGSRAIQRTTDFVTAGDLAASSLNEQLDGLTIMVQQLAEENKRTMKAPPYDPEAVDDGGILNMQLPTKANRAGKVLAFDTDGNPAAGSISLPSSLTATYYPRVNTGGTAYELRSPASVRADIGADDASNLTSGTVSDSRLPATMAGKTLTSVTISSGTITGITDLAIADGGTGASTAANARTNLGLAIGTDVQAYDPQLTDVAGLTPGDGNFIVGDGTNFITESGATARTSLGLGSIATQDANNVTITGGSISGVTFAYTTPLAIPGTSSSTGEIRLAEDTDNGTNYVGLKAPASITANLSWTLPAADGLSGQFLGTDGSGTLSWSTPSGAGDVVGAASSTDNALARFDGTSGKAIQNSGATLSDTGVLTVTEVSTDTISEKTAAAGVTIDGVLLKDSAVTTDTINEKTAAAGVTVDGVLLKDSAVNTDTINEKTSAAGVTIDGVLLKDSAVTTDTINEKTSGAGVTIDSVLIKDGTVAMASPFAMRNKIINGAMQIDQRSNGASLTAANGVYSLDRWFTWASQSSKYTVQQNAGGVTPPTGFINYLGVTSSSAYSVLAADYFGIVQPIEGINVADLAWGTASASTVTLSFWVRSSLTGTFGGAVQNSAQSRCYPFTYVINGANTWEYKTISIPGDTSGTWLTTNATGIRLVFGLGVGSTYSGTAGAWAGTQYISATGATSVVGTNGATWYVTGVQLEDGAVATPFERRQITTELQLCQRYFVQWTGDSSATGFALIGTGYSSSTTSMVFAAMTPTTMRSTPTLTYAGTISIIDGGSAAVTSFGSLYKASPSNFWGVINASGGGLTLGRGAVLYTQNATTSYFRADAEIS